MSTQVYILGRNWTRKRNKEPKEPRSLIMENVTIQVWKKATDTTPEFELNPQFLGLVSLTDPVHRGKKHITYAQDGNPEKTFNVGTIDPDGNVQAQPDYRIRVKSDDGEKTIGDDE